MWREEPAARPRTHLISCCGTERFVLLSQLAQVALSPAAQPPLRHARCSWDQLAAISHACIPACGCGSGCGGLGIWAAVLQVQVQSGLER